MNQQESKWRSCFRNDLFLHKVALVTGGGTGIGRSIAKELASLGATVVISSRDEDKCKIAAKEMNEELKLYGNGTKGKVVGGPSCSIREEEDVENLITHIIETYGGIHMLVNNAGGQFVCSAEDMSAGGFAAVVDTNLKGTFLCCREAYTQYMRDHGGSIVNITLGNRNGMPAMVHSGAARAGIENMTATLCSEWIESDVRINCVRPGIVWTDSGFANYGKMGDEFLARCLVGQPAKRLASTEEISSAVTWLLCEGASYVTGTTLSVDGGSAYHFLPIIDIENAAHLPVYGSLPTKAKL
jgi:peroxisomal trans-2-enoyl-CoA reductase